MGLLIIVVAAQFLDATDLGHFSFGVATCLLVVSLARAICGETLVVRSTGSSDRRRGSFRESKSMLGLAMILSGFAAAVCAGVALFATNWNNLFLASAIAIPGLVIQDSLRFHYIAAQKTASLLINDLMTLLLSIAGIAICGQATHDFSAMLVTWGLASLTVSALSFLFSGTLPSLLTGPKWLRMTWGSSSAFVTEAAMGALIGYTIVVILAVFVAPADVAAFRATLSVYGLANLVINFLRTQVLRELRRDMLDTRRSILSIGLKLSLPVIITILGMFAGLVLMPEWIGPTLFQDTWLLVSLLLVPGAINRLFAGLSIIPTIFLRIQGVTWKATIIRLGILLLSFGLGPLGAYLGGASGALLAESATYAMATVFLFVLSLKTSRTIGRLVDRSPMKEIT